MSPSDEHGDAPDAPDGPDGPDAPFGPPLSDDDPFRPQWPLRDPLQPDFDPFLQIPRDPFRPPGDPFDPRRDRIDPVQPDPAPPATSPPGPPWETPPAPPQGGPAQPPEGSAADRHGAEGRQGQAVPSRAARHQAKRRARWRPSRGPGAPGPAERTRSGGPPPVDSGPAGGPPGSTTGPFDRVPRGRPPGSATGPFDRVPLPGRPPGSTTGPFDAVTARERTGSTGELPAVASNGQVERQAPPRPDKGARHSRPPRKARQRPALPKLDVPYGLARTTLGLAAILIAATVGLGAATSALPRARPPATPATAAPYSARWICPLLPNQTTSVGVANIGGAAAALRTTVVGSGRGAPATSSLAARGTRAVGVPAAKQPGYVQVEAFSAPVVVTAGGQPSCAAGPTDRWWIPAADTSLGARTSVVVANPDNDPAVVDLVPHVNQGALAAAAELFVPPRSAVVKTLSNGELIALKPAIEVIAKSGRVVAGALIALKDKQKIFVPGQSTTRPEWSFAGGLAGAERSTYVLITNPSSSPLSVSVQVSTDRGTFKPGNDFDNPVPAGAAVAIQVPPLRIGGSGAFAVRVRSRDGAHFVAALRVTTPAGVGTTTYMDRGTGDSDRSWFVPAVPTSRQVVLANLGGGPVSAQLTTAGAGAGGRGGGEVTIGPGKVVVRQVPAGARSVQVATDRPGLLVAPLGGGLAVPGADIGGVPAGGPVVPGPAAA